MSENCASSPSAKSSGRSARRSTTWKAPQAASSKVRGLTKSPSPTRTPGRTEECRFTLMAVALKMRTTSSVSMRSPPRCMKGARVVSPSQSLPQMRRS